MELLYIFAIVISVILMSLYVLYRINTYFFREMDEIVPGLYLGNLKDAQNGLLLER